MVNSTCKSIPAAKQRPAEKRERTGAVSTQTHTHECKLSACRRLARGSCPAACGRLGIVRSQTASIACRRYASRRVAVLLTLSAVHGRRGSLPLFSATMVPSTAEQWQLPLTAGATTSCKRLQALNRHTPAAAQSSCFCRGHQRSRGQAAQTMHSLRRRSLFQQHQITAH